MKPNKAGNDMWLRAQTTNQNFKKKKPQTQDADCIQAVSLLYITQLETTSQQQYISLERRGGCVEPSVLHVSAEALAK